MSERIALSERLQEMEHSNLQLASETETIGTCLIELFFLFPYIIISIFIFGLFKIHHISILT